MLKIDKPIKQAGLITLGSLSSESIFRFAVAGRNVEGDVMWIRGFYTLDSADVVFENAVLAERGAPTETNLWERWTWHLVEPPF